MHEYLMRRGAEITTEIMHLENKAIFPCSCFCICSYSSGHTSFLLYNMRLNGLLDGGIRYMVCLYLKFESSGWSGQAKHGINCVMIKAHDALQYCQAS